MNNSRKPFVIMLLIKECSCFTWEKQLGQIHHLRNKWRVQKFLSSSCYIFLKSELMNRTSLPLQWLVSLALPVHGSFLLVCSTCEERERKKGREEWAAHPHCPMSSRIHLLDQKMLVQGQFWLESQLHTCARLLWFLVIKNEAATGCFLVFYPPLERIIIKTTQTLKSKQVHRHESCPYLCPFLKTKNLRCQIFRFSGWRPTPDSQVILHSLCFTGFQSSGLKSRYNKPCWMTSVGS